MPTAALTPCANPGCPELVERGRCDAHRVAQRQAYDRATGTSAQRGYDETWRRFVLAYRQGRDLDLSQPGAVLILEARNRCAHCWTEGRRNSDRLEYDHIIPLSAGGARLDVANVQPLCDSHHRVKTWRERQGTA